MPASPGLAGSLGSCSPFPCCIQAAAGLVAVPLTPPVWGASSPEPALLQICLFASISALQLRGAAAALPPAGLWLCLELPSLWDYSPVPGKPLGSWRTHCAESWTESQMR